ncbi:MULTISPECIES: hypothetical protein, partial [unclassified Sphingomonas]|uniref:hypothetical protein n=1 Tax=unclassified Sphingomonas TaxID=196159 RepID=UPI00226AE7DD
GCDNRSLESEPRKRLGSKRSHPVIRSLFSASELQPFIHVRGVARLSKTAAPRKPYSVEASGPVACASEPPSTWTSNSAFRRCQVSGAPMSSDAAWCSLTSPGNRVERLIISSGYSGSIGSVAWSITKDYHAPIAIPR